MRVPPDRAMIDAELRTIGRDGHVVRSSRDLVGVTDIVAPVLLRDGEAIATLVVSYLDRRQTAPGEHESVLEPLLRVCAELAERLEIGSAVVGR